MRRFVRSWLYVSGGRPHQFDKALTSSADAIVFDLEDAVAASAKAEARDNVVSYLRDVGSRRAFVRINPPVTPAGQADLAALDGLSIGGVRVPKVESHSDLAVLNELSHAALEEFEAQPIIETARGLRNLDAILTSPLVRRVNLGEGDLSSDLNISDRKWLDGIRIDVVVASRAAGAWPPIQGVYPRLDDLDGLTASTRAGTTMGFFGRSVIHPRQADVVNTALTPSAVDVERSNDVLRLVGEHGSGRLGDGTFVDAASVRAARRCLELAAALEHIADSATV